MKRILTFGVFDYFHLGHLRLFKQCKQYGDYLIVAVQNEEMVKRFKPETEILYSTEERIEILQSICIVDEVISYDIVDIDTLNNINFDILALGEDHIGKRFDDLVEYCNRNSKEVVRLKRLQGISSTKIKKELKELK